MAVLTLQAATLSKGCLSFSTPAPTVSERPKAADSINYRLQQTECRSITIKMVKLLFKFKPSQQAASLRCIKDMGLRLFMR